MAGRKLTNAEYNVSTDWEDECESIQLRKHGHYNIEFSEMTTTSAPIIQAGSSIDIDGVMYIFDSNETPTGAAASGTNYVRVYDSAATILAEHTTIAPATYDYLKKGYYDAGGTKRYVLKYTSTGADYSDKGYISSEPTFNFPIGMIYTQYPTKKSPIELGFNGLWTNISSSFAGDFFRAEGGSAAAFETHQNGTVLNHVHNTVIGSHAHSIGVGGGGGNGYANSYRADYKVGTTGSINLGTKTSGNPNSGGGAENRPDNYAIRIWERMS